MNLATPFQFDSIPLPAWTATAIRHTRRAAVQSSIVIKAFAKTIALVIATTAKDLSHYYWLCVQGAGQWAMNRAGITHNPVQAAVRAAYAELVSDEATVTYRRIGHIIRETAMDALVVGLCGVVAISVGVDVVQRGYRAAAKLYRAVYGRINPSVPDPELLPSVSMAIASDELAAALDNFASVVEADQAKAEAEMQYSLEAMQREQAEAPSILGQVWNPAAALDMHLEVARLMALQPVPFALSPDSKLQLERKTARAPRNRSSAPFDIAQGPTLTDQSKANPQLQTKAQRKPRAKAEAGVK